MLGTNDVYPITFMAYIPEFALMLVGVFMIQKLLVCVQIAKIRSYFDKKIPLTKNIFQKIIDCHPFNLTKY